MKLGDAFAFGDRGVVSLVGAGGKTSLMYTLARELTAAGKKVLTTTTTKIFVPGREECPLLIVSNDPQEILATAQTLLAESSHLTAGVECRLSDNKLHGFAPCAIEQIVAADLFDFIIIEADGAARRSLKACAIHEPVVPSFSDCVIAVVGLDVVAKPLTEEWVFRSSIYARVTDLDIGETVTGASIAAMLCHDMSLVATTVPRATKIAFLNKADSPWTRSVAWEIADCLTDGGGSVFDRVVVGQLLERPVVHGFRTLL